MRVPNFCPLCFGAPSLSSATSTTASGNSTLRSVHLITPRGKQSVSELVGQNQGVQNIEISDKNIKDFDRVARKYGIDYAVKKDTTEEIPKYLVFFKARDGDALNAAFREYSAVVAKKKERPSVIQKLRAINPLEQAVKKDRVRHKDKGLEL